MRHVILYRGREFEEIELLAATANGFVCTASRLDIQEGDLVVGRYSVLPFYNEQERDIRAQNATLINTRAQHEYVADIGQWYADLHPLTPTTWGPGEYGSLPEDKAFVIKGQTNSKKFLWNTHMFAPNRGAVPDVLRRVMDDTLLSEQKIYIREYVPLKSYGIAFNGLPITKELRFFVVDQQVLCGAFYWSSHVDELQEGGITVPTADEVPASFIDDVVSRVGNKVRAYGFDVAQTEDDRWVLIELNDLQMSGLSENEPTVFYRRLGEVLGVKSLP